MIAVSRHLKVGQPGDCGRGPGGTFSGSNICSSGRRRDELDEDARIRAKRWIRSPAGRVALAAAKSKDAEHDGSSDDFNRALYMLGVKAEEDSSEVAKVQAVYRAVVGESRAFAKRLGGDSDVTFKAMAPLDLSILKWLAASGHVRALPPLLGSIPIGALTFLLFGSKPSLDMVRRAKKMVKLTMKRVGTGSANKEGKVVYRADGRRLARYRRSVEIKREDIKRAAKRIEKYGDAYFAMLAIALDRTSGDMNDSIRIADHAFRGETGGMSGDRPKSVSRHSKHWRPGRVEAGSAGDCGHNPYSGWFEDGNNCWDVNRRLGKIERKLGVGIDKARPQPKNKLDFVKTALHRVKNLFAADTATPKIKQRLAKVGQSLKAAYHRLFRGKDANSQMKQAADLLKMESASKHRRHRYAHGGKGCGWEESSGRFVDENECQEGDNPGSSRQLGLTPEQSREMKRVIRQQDKDRDFRERQFSGEIAKVERAYERERRTAIRGQKEALRDDVVAMIDAYRPDMKFLRKRLKSGKVDPESVLKDIEDVKGDVSANKHELIDSHKKSLSEDLFDLRRYYDGILRKMREDHLEVGEEYDADDRKEIEELEAEFRRSSEDDDDEHHYAKAGDTDDCGHETASGRFGDDNTCAGNKGDSWEHAKAEARRDLAAQQGAKRGKRPTKSVPPSGEHKERERSHEERYHAIGKALSSIPESQRRGSFGDRAFILHLWHQYQRLDPHASYGLFTRDLLDMARDRKIALHRHDMPQTLTPEEREVAAASAIKPFGEGSGRPEFHTITIPGRSSHYRHHSSHHRIRSSRYKEEHPDAGSAGDCGHKDVSGHFAPENECAGEGEPEVAGSKRPRDKPSPGEAGRPLAELVPGEVAPPALGGLLSPVAEQGSKDIDRLIHRFRNADLTDAAEAAKLLGKEVPEYLKAVQGFIDEQSMKFRQGTLRPRDIAKAWGITIASQGASGMMLENIYDKMPDSPFMKWLAGSNRKRLVAELESHSAGGTCGPHGCKGRVSNAGVVRPEDLAAAWFVSPSGERVLRKMDSGKFDPDDWKELAMLRNVMGDDRFKSTGVFNPSVRNRKGDLVWISKSKRTGKDVLRGRIGFADIPAVTKMINDVGKSSKGKIGSDAEKLTPLVMTLRGIKEGKAGFISHFFGVPDRPTYDAVQLNYWITGAASIKNASTSENKSQMAGMLDEAKKQRLDKGSVKLALDLKKSLGSQQLRQEVIERLEVRLNQLHKILKRNNPGLTLHILHHWLWDKAKGSMTTHSVVYKAMRAMKNISKFLRMRRRPVRYASSLTGPAELLRCFADSKMHSMRVASPKYLSREQVAEILSEQHFRKVDKHGKPRPNPKSADELEHMFCASTLYQLMPIPAWVARTYRRDPIPPGDHSYSTGPIIVDLMKDEDFREKYPHGSFGFDPLVAVLDGNHRLHERKQEFGDESMIDAFIGTEVVDHIKDWVNDFGPRREAFISALNDFYADLDEPSWDRLVETGQSAGLTGQQIYGIWLELKSGNRYNPTLGHFVPVNA